MADAPSQDVANGTTDAIDLAIVIPTLDKYGGAERFVIECVKRWQHRHRITLYSTSFNRQLLREVGIDSSVRLSELDSPFEGAHAFVTNAVLLPKIWRQQIGRHEVYHTHLWPTHLVDLHPMVWFPHEPLRLLHDLRYEQPAFAEATTAQTHVYPKFNYDEIGVDLLDASLAAVEQIDRTAVPEFTVANSRYTADYLSAIYRREMPHVVYPGVNLNDLPRLNVEPNLFVAIGQLWSHKRTNLLIEAVALTDNVQLMIIGAGPELEWLQMLCVKLGVEDRVFFLSGLSNFELQLVLARACALLFCPIREPFGIVVLEAFAAGKPVIAANEGGYVEVCRPEYAVLIPPSPIAFAEAMTKLRDDPERVRKMGQAARSAVTQYSWQRTADELEVFLHKAKAAGGHRSLPTAGSRTRPLIGIQYYLWYGDGYGNLHWNDDPWSGHVADHPFLGFYASEHGRTIEEHLKQFEEMAIDFVILNLHIDDKGANRTEWKSIKTLFEIAHRMNSPLRFVVQIASYTGDIEMILSTISDIENSLVQFEEYFRIDAKPALLWFWSTAYDGNRAFFENVRRRTQAFHNLALSLRIAKGIEETRYTFDFFEGFGLYSPLETASEENWERVWQTALDASVAAKMRYSIVTVSPGYDDRGLADPVRLGNPNRIVPRNDGATYTRALAFAEDASTPDLIIVSTFNEYHENTHIETSLRNGDKYVRMTKDFAMRNQARRLGGKAPDA